MNRILSLVKPRVLSIVLIVLGLLAVILAVASATIWRPSQTAVATLKPAATTAYVVTGDGVLNMVDSTVTITAKAKDANSTVTLALARSEDAQAWLANDPYTEVTGLSSWESLSGRTITERCNVKASATPTAKATGTAASTAKATATASAKATATSTAKASATPTPDAKGCIKAVASKASLNGSDMWVTSKTGKGSVSFTYDPSSSNYVVLAATDGKQPAPTFSLSWKRSVGTPWLIPGLIVGGLLVAGGVFIFMLDIQMRHQELANAQRRRRRQEEAAARLNRDPNRPLTRLELREKAQAEAAGKVWIDPRRDVPSESAADVDADRTIPAAPNPITDSRGIWAVQAAGGVDRVAAAQDQVAPQEGDAVPHLPGTPFSAAPFTPFNGAPAMGSGAPVGSATPFSGTPAGSGAPAMGANPAVAPTPADPTPTAGQSTFSAPSAPQAPVSGPSAASAEQAAPVGPRVSGAPQASPFAPPNSAAFAPKAPTAPIQESALSAASAAHAAVNPFAVHPGTNPFGPRYSSIFDEPASAPSPTPAVGNAALAMERSGASTDVFEPINEPVISAPSAASSSSAHSAPTPAYGQAQVDTASTQDSAPSAASTGSTASAPSADAAGTPGADTASESGVDATSAPTPEQADEPQREDVAKEEN